MRTSTWRLPALAVLVSSVLGVGCGSPAPPPKTPEQIEASRLEHQERSNRERMEK